VAGLAWGYFEAGWVRLRTRRCPIPGLPPELDGLRIVHLSDFHLGVPSRGAVAVERAVEWAAGRSPDLVCVTGDLLTRPGGAERLRRALERIPTAYLVLGNHDYGIALDPLARRAVPYDTRPARLLDDESVDVELRGRRVQIVGLDPRPPLGWHERAASLADPGADLRILLFHFPQIVDKLEAGLYHLVLAGHMHDGQISVPYGFGKLRLAHPRFEYPSGIYRLPVTTLHVSPGLGTSFVPFRFCARPEATELVLQSA
jgi:predicted MPP superfamily phosphohydrolase